LKVVTYDEIEPEDAMLIDEVCFRVPTPPDKVKMIRRLDKRCPDYYGVYAKDDDGNAVSQVVVLHIDTQTREGREKVAGIQAVATLPGHLRRGMSTELMRRVHELLREQGIRISFLLTSSSLVAHGMFAKIGYTTLATFDRGYKRIRKEPEKQQRVQLRKFDSRVASRLDELFSSQTRDRLGFIHRQDGFMAMLVKTNQATPEKLKFAYMGGKVVGYTSIQEEASVVNMDELVGIDDPTRSSILDQVERQPHALWAHCYGLCDARLSQLYRSKGYRLHEPCFGRVMVASVDGSLTGDEIAKLYGKDENRFVIYSLDCF
jgi:predicted acetyltransferase